MPGLGIVDLIPKPLLAIFATLGIIACLPIGVLYYVFLRVYCKANHWPFPDEWWAAIARPGFYLGLGICIMILAIWNLIAKAIDRK